MCRTSSVGDAVVREKVARAVGVCIAVTPEVSFGDTAEGNCDEGTANAYFHAD